MQDEREKLIEEIRNKFDLRLGLDIEVADWVTAREKALWERIKELAHPDVASCRLKECLACSYDEQIEKLEQENAETKLLYHEACLKNKSLLEEIAELKARVGKAVEILKEKSKDCGCSCPRCSDENVVGHCMTCKPGSKSKEINK